MLVQVEQSQQDQLEAIQQQQDVLLLAFTRFRDLLLEAEKASDDLNAGAPGEMNGTADNAAGKREIHPCTRDLHMNACSHVHRLCLSSHRGSKAPV